MRNINNTDYSITKDGNVFSHKTKKWLKERTDRGGYKYYELYINNVKKKKFTHRLLGYAFLDLQDNEFIDHINGIRDDNRLSNLDRVDNVTNCNRGKLNKNNLPNYVSKTRRKNGWSDTYKYVRTIDGKSTQFVGSTQLEDVLSFKYTYENNY